MPPIEQLKVILELIDGALDEGFMTTHSFSPRKEQTLIQFLVTVEAKHPGLIENYADLHSFFQDNV